MKHSKLKCDLGKVKRIEGLCIWQLVDSGRSEDPSFVNVEGLQNYL